MEEELLSTCPHSPDDGLPTATTEQQHRLEELVFAMRQYFLDYPEYRVNVTLHRDAHVEYLRGAFRQLPESYAPMVGSQHWFVYWASVSLQLLGEFGAADAEAVLAHYVGRQNSDGGFPGGPGMGSHTMACYTAVAALTSLLPYRPDALDLAVDRPRMLRYLRARRMADGSFSTHVDGDSDVRALYCAVVVAALLGFDAADLFADSVPFLLACQTHEGGFGGVPFAEAHGGYTYCAVSALNILGCLQRCDVDALMRWLVERQMPLAGGFQGRANKLVDSCYSYWVGGALAQIPVVLPPAALGHCVKLRVAALGAHPVAARLRDSDTSGRAAVRRAYLLDEANAPGQLMFDQRALQEYLLTVAQDAIGGFHDKPGKFRDHYHTAYSLLGLSIAMLDAGGGAVVLGRESNRIARAHPSFGVPVEAIELWRELQPPHRPS
jgi:protein farnesyltransferase subunit beta